MTNVFAMTKTPSGPRPNVVEEREREYETISFSHLANNALRKKRGKRWMGLFILQNQPEMNK